MVALAIVWGWHHILGANKSGAKSMSLVWGMCFDASEASKGKALEALEYLYRDLGCRGEEKHGLDIK